MDLEKEALKMKDFKGKIRGEGILTDLEYIRLKEKEAGVKKIETKINGLDYKIKFKEIESMEWYPAQIDVLKNLILMDSFGWTEKDIFNMANFAPKVSFLVRIFTKYFISIKKSFRESPKYWKQHFDFGELEAYELDVKEKKMIFRLKDYDLHPLMCVVFRGYFLRIAQFVVKSKEIEIKETKCFFKNDPYHEYVISWK